MPESNKRCFFLEPAVSARKRKHSPRGRRSLQRDNAIFTLEMCANSYISVVIEADTMSAEKKQSIFEIQMPESQAYFTRLRLMDLFSAWIMQ